MLDPHAERFQRLEELISRLRVRIARIEENSGLPPARLPGTRPFGDPLAELEFSVRELLYRVTAIEKEFNLQGVKPSAVPPSEPAPPPEPVPPPFEIPTPATTVSRIEEPPIAPIESHPSYTPHEVPPAPPPAHRKPRPADTPSDWERLIGGKWALWVGSILVFFTVAYFLRDSWANISHEWRLAIGFISGFVFMGVGETQRKKTVEWFSQGLVGTGIGLIYLTIWGGYQRYALFDFNIAFLLMAVTTAFGLFLAIQNDAITLQALATIGGFLTPILLQTHGAGESRAVPFLSYIAFLNAAILVTSIYKRWRGILVLAFAATCILVFGWADQNPDDGLRLTLFSFLTVYFLMFTAATGVPSLLRGEEADGLDIFLMFAVSVAYASSGYPLIERSLGDFPATFPLALALFYALLGMTSWTTAPNNTFLRRMLGALSILFLTVAVPIQLHRGWIAVAWCVESAVLGWLAVGNKSTFFRGASRIVWGFALVAVWWTVLTAEMTNWVLLINDKSLPLLAFVGASAWLGYLARDADDEDEEKFSSLHSFAAVISGAWLIAQETHFVFRYGPGSSAGSWQAASVYFTAALLSVYALAVFWQSLKWRNTHLQVAGLLVMSIATAFPLWASAAYSPKEWTPFVNWRWLAFLVVVGCLAALTKLLSTYADQLAERRVGLSIWTPLAAAILVAVAISIEVYRSFAFWSAPGAESWEVAALFALVMWWFIFAVLMLMFGIRSHMPEFRTVAFIFLAFALADLLYDSFAAFDLGWAPLFNWRFFAFLSAVAALLISTKIVSKDSDSLHPMEVSLVGYTGVIGALLGLWGVTQEVYEAFRFYRAEFADWSRAAQMGVSVAWTLYAAALVLFGMSRRIRYLRIFALILFGVTALKLVVLDLSFLTGNYRLLSFGALGGVLIGISWFYSRLEHWAIGKDE